MNGGNYNLPIYLLGRQPFKGHNPKLLGSSLHSMWFNSLWPRIYLFALGPVLRVWESQDVRYHIDAPGFTSATETVLSHWWELFFGSFKWSELNVLHQRLFVLNPRVEKSRQEPITHQIQTSWEGHTVRSRVTIWCPYWSCMSLEDIICTTHSCKNKNKNEAGAS